MGKYSRKHKKSGLLLAIALLLLVAVGGTLAYILTNTDALENVFNPSRVSCAVVEDQKPEGAENGQVSVTQKTNVKIKNTGDTDAYIRVALVVTWKNEKGEVWGKAPVSPRDYSIHWTFKDAQGDDVWVPVGDGYLSVFYYKKPVAPGEMTETLIGPDGITPIVTGPVGADGTQYYFSVEVVASAIQADGLGTTNPEQAWAKAVE